jgi:thioredoxin reductase
VHGFLTRDGVAPAELLRLGREEVARYDTVAWREVEVVEAVRGGDAFLVRCADGSEHASRKLLLATGVVDELPRLEGIEALYGRSVHHCPFCDGWEWRDQPIAAYGPAEHGAGLALGLTAWSRDVVLCTDGPAQLADDLRGRLGARAIPVREERIACLEGVDGLLARVVFADGSAIERRALFFATGQFQASDLPARLGCRFNERGAVDTGKCEATNVAGLYVCGDASKEAQFVVVAAAEGSEAGMAISRALLEEDLARDSDVSTVRTAAPPPA